MYKTIKENVSAEIVEKKSKFIANLFYIESREEAEDIIKMQKKKYYDARHNCYAFRVLVEDGIIEKSSDVYYNNSLFLAALWVTPSRLSAV